ncbi:MAG TPA: SH3 domain-containing protein [Chloroflexota bacterium]|nr:SH3 domain-containing protein [Chloroflexota bacterium]
MAIKAGHATTRSPRYALGPGVDLPVARIVALLLILLPIGVWFVITAILKAPPSQEAVDLANFNPRAMFADNTPHFLPPPVAAIPAESNAGPPASAADEQPAAGTAPVEHVKVANTGGVGAILRADPPKGRQVGALRDGTVLQVLEHRQLDDSSEWLRVQTPDGVEGWVFSKLVAASE